MYAYQKLSKSTQWIQPCVSTLQKNADCLVQNGLYHPSSDPIQAIANQTVLAIHSAIGIGSFAELTSKATCASKAKQFVDNIVQFAPNPEGNHIRTPHNDAGAPWIGTYRFAFDKLLEFRPFKNYEMQSKWYEAQEYQNDMQFSSEVNKTGWSARSRCGTPLLCCHKSTISPSTASTRRSTTA